jgi:hypothetical protein
MCVFLAIGSFGPRFRWPSAHSKDRHGGDCCSQTQYQKCPQIVPPDFGNHLVLCPNFSHGGPCQRCKRSPSCPFLPPSSHRADITVVDMHVACCEMRAVRNGTLLSLRFCGFLRPATRRPSLWRSLLGSRLIQHQFYDLCDRLRSLGGRSGGGLCLCLCCIGAP